MSSLDRPEAPTALTAVGSITRGQPYVALEDSLGVFSGQVLISTRRCSSRWSATSTAARRFLNSRAGSSTRVGRSTTTLADLRRPWSRKLDRAMVLEGSCVLGVRRPVTLALRGPARRSHAGRSYAGDADDRSGADLDGRFFEECPAGAGTPEIGPRERVGCPIDPGHPQPPHRLRPGGAGLLARLQGSGRADPTPTSSVILGVAHQHCRHRFAASRVKDGQTPARHVARPTMAFVEVTCAGVAGDHLFEDELAHRNEHSIEFQVSVPPASYWARPSRFPDRADPRRLVPRPDAIRGRSWSPTPKFVRGWSRPSAPPRRRRARRSRTSAGSTSATSARSSATLPRSTTQPLPRSRASTRSMLDRAVGGGRAAGWFSKAARVDNRWRVCGLAATYTLLQAIGPARGRLLDYDQALNPSRTCCVTFASVAFEPEPAGTRIG